MVSIDDSVGFDYNEVAVAVEDSKVVVVMNIQAGNVVVVDMGGAVLAVVAVAVVAWG